MKCYTRYMLPLVTLLLVFLCSAFFRLEVKADSFDSLNACMDSIISCNSETYPFVVLMGDPINMGDYLQYTVYLSESELLYDSHADVLYYLDCKYRFYHYCYIKQFSNGSCSVTSVIEQSHTSNSSNSIRLQGKPILSSSCDIYYQVNGLGEKSDEIFFQGPSPFQQAVRGQDWTTVMTEIVIMVPLLILFLVSLIGLRKGLRFVSSFLHRA